MRIQGYSLVKLYAEAKGNDKLRILVTSKWGEEMAPGSKRLQTSC